METSETGRQGPVEAAIDPSVPVVSVVIPAYNEARRIGPSIESIFRYIEDHNMPMEAIVVDDGSTDGTADIAASSKSANLKVVSNGTNRGKGYSVREGFRHAKGTWVLFTDADLSAPFGQLDLLLDAAEAGADVVIGSRALDRNKILVHQSRFREFGGIFFNWTVQALLGLRFKDTQCGFKLFHREKMLPIFEEQTIFGFGFDPEILFLAHRRGLRIREIPVAWSHDAGSKVRFARDGSEMFRDLVRIRWNWMRGRYR